MNSIYVFLYKFWRWLKVYLLTKENWRKIAIVLGVLFVVGVLSYGGNKAYKSYQDSLIMNERDLEIEKYNEEMQKYESRERVAVGDKIDYKTWQDRISKVPSDATVMDAGLKIITIHDEESRELASASLKWVNYVAQGDIGSKQKDYGFYNSAKSATLLYSGKTFTNQYQEYLMIYKTLGVSGAGKTETKIERLHLVYIGDKIARWYID
jgi:hypothetical protein